MPVDVRTSRTADDQNPMTLCQLKSRARPDRPPLEDGDVADGARGPLPRPPEEDPRRGQDEEGSVTPPR